MRGHGGDEMEHPCHKGGSAFRLSCSIFGVEIFRQVHKGRGADYVDDIKEKLNYE